MRNEVIVEERDGNQGLRQGIAGREPARTTAISPSIEIVDRTNSDRGSMSTTTTPVSVASQPELLGQAVVLIGGSSGIGLETARHARARGADVILTGRTPEPLEHAAREIGALQPSCALFFRGRYRWADCR